MIQRFYILDSASLHSVMAFMALVPMMFFAGARSRVGAFKMGNPRFKTGDTAIQLANLFIRAARIIGSALHATGCGVSSGLSTLGCSPCAIRTRLSPLGGRVAFPCARQCLIGG